MGEWKCKECEWIFDNKLELTEHVCSKKKPSDEDISKAELSQNDLKTLISACYVLSKLAQPILFKSISAAGVSEGEMKGMYSDFAVLAEKYNK